MRVLFFGTAAFAVPSLQQLCSSAHRVIGVVTQPDKPAGRGQQLTATPVAELAHAHGLPLLQPVLLNDPTTRETLRGLTPDIIAVVAYGKFLPTALLNLPPRRCVNVHPSLLPKYRGAAPINWAIVNGETTTGVTTMYVSEAMDAGDILLQQEVPIGPGESAVELSERLAPIGASLLLATLDQLASDRVVSRPQDPTQVTLAPALTKAAGRIDWRRPARQLMQQILGLQPWPNAYTSCEGTPLTIFRTEVLDAPTVAAPGTVVAVTRAIHVATGEGQLCLTEVQLAGKRRMSTQEFLRGHRIEPGITFG